jgi:hypothetical protein
MLTAMAKQGLKSNLSSADEANHQKVSLKEVGQNIGGNPDKWDYENLKKLIDTYDKAFPGRLKKMKEDVMIEAALSGRTKDYGVISKDSDMRVGFWLPEDLQQVIERGYPSFWTNKKHAAWFIKKFPLFMRAEKF